MRSHARKKSSEFLNLSCPRRVIQFFGQSPVIDWFAVEAKKLFRLGKEIYDQSKSPEQVVIGYTLIDRWGSEARPQLVRHMAFGKDEWFFRLGPFPVDARYGPYETKDEALAGLEEWRRKNDPGQIFELFPTQRPKRHTAVTKLVHRMNLAETESMACIANRKSRFLNVCPRLR